MNVEVMAAAVEARRILEAPIHVRILLARDGRTLGADARLIVRRSVFFEERP